MRVVSLYDLEILYKYIFNTRKIYILHQVF